MFDAKEVAALNEYTGDGYRLINGYLRGLEPETAKTRRLVDVIDRAIAKSKIADSIVVFRGIDGDAAKYLRLFNFELDDEFDDLGFASTSTEHDSAALFASWPAGGLILKIHLKAGTSAIAMRDVSQHPDEFEYLLGREQRFKILAVSVNSRIIEVETC